MQRCCNPASCCIRSPSANTVRTARPDHQCTVCLVTALRLGSSIEIGEVFGGGASSPRIDALVARLVEAGVAATASPDIRKALWTKLISMACSGPIGAVTRAPLDVISTQPETAALLLSAMEEARAGWMVDSRAAACAAHVLQPPQSPCAPTPRLLQAGGVAVYRRCTCR